MPIVHLLDKPLVYVAGPYRAIVKKGSNWEIYNHIRHAEGVGLWLWEMGAAAIVPHANTAHYQNELPDHIWIEGDLCILDRCDAIVMLSTWELSEGAREEKLFAEMMGIPVFEEADVDKIREWIDGFRANRRDGTEAGNTGQKRSIWRSFRGLFKNGVPVQNAKEKQRDGRRT